MTQKRRWTSLVTALLLLVIFMPMQTQAKNKVEAPKKNCHAYVVMDAGSGEVLFGQDEDKMIYPASTAKLMTAIVCNEQGDTSAKIKTEYDVVHGCIYGLYTIGIPANTTFTFKDLQAISLITSAGDATDSLAVGVFGSKKACVDAMQAKVAEMGLTNTSFDNPDGSDIGAGLEHTYSTATEMGLVTRYAMTIPLVREVVAMNSYETSNGLIEGYTTNRFIRGTAYYDKSKYKVIGSKSGTTNAAGNVFIATAVDKKGHEVICGFFGGVTKEDTFDSIRRLFDYTFEQYEAGNLTLTKNYRDVRCSKDLGEVFDRYVSLNCYPNTKSGLFVPGKAISRKDLARMLNAIDNLKGNAIVSDFYRSNETGEVSVKRLAMLVQELYPSFLSEEKVTSLLADCQNTEGLSAQEKNALAILVEHGLCVDDAMKNANHMVTRKEALLFADKLNEYQMVYAATMPMLAGAQAKSEADTDAISMLPMTSFNTKVRETMDEQMAAIKAEEEKAKKEAEKKAEEAKAAEEKAKKEAEAATATTKAETTTQSSTTEAKK